MNSEPVPVVILTKMSVHRPSRPLNQHFRQDHRGTLASRRPHTRTQPSRTSAGHSVGYHYRRCRWRSGRTRGCTSFCRICHSEDCRLARHRFSGDRTALSGQRSFRRGTLFAHARRRRLGGRALDRRHWSALAGSVVATALLVGSQPAALPSAGVVGTSVSYLVVSPAERSPAPATGGNTDGLREATGPILVAPQDLPDAHTALVPDLTQSPGADEATAGNRRCPIDVVGGPPPQLGPGGRRPLPCLWRI